MISLQRTHDFQVFLSPADKQLSSVNPPRFNWPQDDYHATYTLELEALNQNKHWCWENVSSPFQLPLTLNNDEYRWRLINDESQSDWLTFQIDEASEYYFPPSAQAIFNQCEGRDQFLMYFDEDINRIRISSWTAHDKLIKTAALTDIDAITYPNHYRRGLGEGKRTAIANVREWIDRDLISLCLLYKIWGDETSGSTAVQLLLHLAEWSPEGPASLLRPCTWGDEVGLSLSRNLFLAYHWLSPLLTDSEKDFIRPMLVRISYQMEDRLEEDKFKQFPGHSHTSRLPAYLGIAAIALHKEFDRNVCERWLNYALMIYQNVLPFYGGEDGSWAEGPFYSSSYSKWQHPFFLSIERISGFSFYNHPFYKNYYKFAMDFVATEESIHPFGDGFWCTRDGKEWPGFFAQNPLRIYADRFGDKASRTLCNQLETQITTYDLHLLDVIPTIQQMKYSVRPLTGNRSVQDNVYYQYYDFAGFGKIQQDKAALYFRASQFGNSSHRHADQGNIAFIDNNTNVIMPSGSYGYRFGSSHHSEWTRTTKAHNLPLIDGIGQILDDESAVASVIAHQSGKNWGLVQFDVSSTYLDLPHYVRTVIAIEKQGLLIIDHLQLNSEKSIQWRLHSELPAKPDNYHVQLHSRDFTYNVGLHDNANIIPNVTQGYDFENMEGEHVISDANQDLFHLEWCLAPRKEHLIIGHCAKNAIDYHVENQTKINISTGFETIVLNIENNKISTLSHSKEVA